MDSMRPLSNSLPPSRKRLDQPELLSDFKAAALSVTNLFKSAGASQEKARAAGYQDALEDLISFLDRENLGVMDGEGWSVRQWATERLSDDGTQRQTAATASDDEVEEARQQQQDTRSSSPETQRKPQLPSLPVSSSALSEISPRRTAVSEPPPTYPSSPAQPQPPAREDFSFRSSHGFSSNHDREAGSMDLDNSSTVSTPTTPNAETGASVRLIPRSGRGRHTNHNRRNITTGSTPTINFNLGAGSGNKRKIPYPDFFDISGTNFEGHDRKEGGGGSRGGKRSRHV